DSLAQQPRGVGGAYAGAQARREFRSAIGGGSTVLGHLPNPVRHGQETGSELLRVHLRARQRWCAQVARVDRFKGSGSSAWRLLGCHVESPRIIEKIPFCRLSPSARRCATVMPAPSAARLAWPEFVRV